MAEQEPREVGAAMWGGRPPPGEATARARAAAAREIATAPRTQRTIGLRDAAALGCLTVGGVGVAVATAVLFGPWALVLLVAAVIAGVGILLGFGEAP